MQLWLMKTLNYFLFIRYRNFRTFTTPRPTQFSCLTVDPSGEIVCAGSEESFEIYVWAVPTGRLLSVSCYQLNIKILFNMFCISLDSLGLYCLKNYITYIFIWICW